MFQFPTIYSCAIEGFGSFAGQRRLSILPYRAEGVFWSIATVRNSTFNHIPIVVRRPSRRGVSVFIEPPTICDSIPAIVPQLIHHLLYLLPACSDSYFRRNLILAGLRDNVRHATLPDLLGGCSALRPKSQVLHLSQQRFHHPDQGESFHPSPHSS